MRAVERAVAERRLGQRAQAGHRAGRSEPLRLRRLHVGRVHQAPARVDRHLVHEPGDRTPVRPGDAVVDFLDLLGDVDVDRTIGRGGNDRAQRLRGNGA